MTISKYQIRATILAVAMILAMCLPMQQASAVCAKFPWCSGSVIENYCVASCDYGCANACQHVEYECSPGERSVAEGCCPEACCQIT